MISLGRLARLSISMLTLVLAICEYAVTETPTRAGASAAISYAYDQPGEHAHAITEARSQAWPKGAALQRLRSGPASQMVVSAATGFAAEDAGGIIYRTGSRTENALTDSSGVSFRDSVSSSASAEHPQVFRPGDKIWGVEPQSCRRAPWFVTASQPDMCRCLRPLTRSPQRSSRTRS